MAHFIFGGIGVKLDDVLQRVADTCCEVVSYDGVVDDSKIYQLHNLEQLTTLELQDRDSIWMVYCAAIDLVTDVLQSGDIDLVISYLEQWHHETRNVIELKRSNPRLQLINITEASVNIKTLLNILDPLKKISLESNKNTTIADIISQNVDLSVLIADVEIKSIKFDVESVYFQARELEFKLFELTKLVEINTDAHKVSVEQLTVQYEQRITENTHKQNLLETKLAEATKNAELNQAKIIELTKLLETNTGAHKIAVEQLIAQYEQRLTENTHKQKLLETKLVESTEVANKRYEELKEKSILLLEEKIKEINSLKDEKSNFEQKDILKKSRIERLELEQCRLVDLNKNLETDCANLNAKLKVLEITIHDLTEKLQMNSNTSEVIIKQVTRAEAQIDIIKELVLIDNTDYGDFLKLK